jgi:hypothetical protein
MMSGVEDCRSTFDNLKAIANNSFNAVTNLALFSLGWEEQFAKVWKKNYFTLMDNRHLMRSLNCGHISKRIGLALNYLLIL